MAEERPDIYFDFFQSEFTPNSVVLHLGVFGRKAGQPSDVGQIRTSYTGLKELAYFIRKGLKEYEQKVGPTPEVSNKRLDELKVAPEDWTGFWK